MSEEIKESREDKVYTRMTRASWELFLILLVLKLLSVASVAQWSWWWVTAPLWGGFVLSRVSFAITVFRHAKIRGAPNRMSRSSPRWTPSPASTTDSTGSRKYER